MSQYTLPDLLDDQLLVPIVNVIHKPSCQDVARRRVALVSMPFYSCRWPSIQLGLLKSVLNNSGFYCSDIYLNMVFANWIGWIAYDKLSLVNLSQAGEWLFGYGAYGIKNNAEDEQYFDIYGKRLKEMLMPTDDFKNTLLKIRYDLVPIFLDACIKRIDWDRFDTVGFSCTFQQTVPSIALARRIKEFFPRVSVVFGGSAVEEKMGQAVLDAHSFIDQVVSGEGEASFIELLQKSGGRPQRQNDPKIVVAKNITNLDSLPLGDYSSFYDLCKLYKYEGLEFACELAVPLELIGNKRIERKKSSLSLSGG